MYWASTRKCSRECPRTYTRIAVSNRSESRLYCTKCVRYYRVSIRLRMRKSKHLLSHVHTRYISREMESLLRVRSACTATHFSCFICPPCVMRKAHVYQRNVAHWCRTSGLRCTVRSMCRLAFGSDVLSACCTQGRCVVHATQAYAVITHTHTLATAASSAHGIATVRKSTRKYSAR